MMPWREESEGGRSICKAVISVGLSYHCLLTSEKIQWMGLGKNITAEPPFIASIYFFHLH